MQKNMKQMVEGGKKSHQNIPSCQDAHSRAEANGMGPAACRASEHLPCKEARKHFRKNPQADLLCPPLHFANSRA